MDFSELLEQIGFDDWENNWKDLDFRYRDLKGSKRYGGDEPITIYRATDIGSTIRPGDWVSTNIEYIYEFAGEDARILVAQTKKKFLVDMQAGDEEGDTLIYVPDKKKDLPASIFHPDD